MSGRTGGVSFEAPAAFASSAEAATAAWSKPRIEGEDFLVHFER